MKLRKPGRGADDHENRDLRDGSAPEQEGHRAGPDGEDASQVSPETNLAGVVERNIESLLRMRQTEEDKLSRQEKAARAVTRFAGSLRFVYLHAAVVAAWFLVNLGLTPLPRFDPTFVVLAMVASVEAIFLTSLVLITQNRMQVDADRRAELDLQISLLSEHEITRLISLTGAIARQTGTDVSRVPDLPELEKDVRPEQVFDRMVQREAEANGEPKAQPGRGSGEPTEDREEQR